MSSFHANLVMNVAISFSKIVHGCVPEVGEKMLFRVLIWPYVVSLRPWHLIFWPQNLVNSSQSPTAPNL